MKSLRMALLVAVTALGVTAFSATAAHAQEWAIEGEELSTLGGSAGITSEDTENFKLAGEVLNQKITIECTTQTATGEILEGGLDKATVQFTGCKVLNLGACVVKEPIVTNAKTRLIKIGSTFYDVFEPESGSTFVTITIEKCALAGSYEVKGATCGEGEEEGVELVEQPLRFSEAVAKACDAADPASIALTLGGKPATLTGAAVNELTAPHAGKVFGAI